MAGRNIVELYSRASGTEEVPSNWEEIKAKEKEGKGVSATCAAMFACTRSLALLQ